MDMMIISFITMSMGVVIGICVGMSVTDNKMKKKLNNACNMSNKHLALFKMMNEWVRKKQDGKNLEDYFIKNDFKTIAIYGMSYAGQTLVNELKDSDVIVKYGMDKNANERYLDLEVFKPKEGLEPVDAIIVTPITYAWQIECELGAIFDCPIISLEDVLYEMD